MTLPIFDKKKVESLIPQKFPFVMVSELINFSDDILESCFTIEDENILVQEEHLQASGVLEHQAQSVALHSGYKNDLLNLTPPVGYIGAVKSFNIEFLPKVGDKICTTVKIVSEMLGVTLVTIESTVDGKILATSEMKTVIKA